MFVERPYCTVCGGANPQVVLREPYDGPNVGSYLQKFYGLDKRGLWPEIAERLRGWDFVLQACPDCWALTQRFAPDDDLSLEIYSKWIDEDPAREHKKAPPLPEYVHQIQEAMILTSFVLGQTRKSVPSKLNALDFGAGWGRFAVALKATGCRVYVVEFSPERREAARRNGLIVVDEQELPQIGFDFINTEQVFEHLAEPLVLGQLLSKSLNHGGVLKISVPFARPLERGGPPNIDWTRTEGPRSPRAVTPLEHLTYFRRPSLNIMAGKLGLAEVRLSAVQELNFSFGWGSARSVGKNLARPFIRHLIRNYRLSARA